MRAITRIALSFLVLATSAVPVAAATESVLYSFSKVETSGPSGKLYLRNGSLYGTTAGGGYRGGYGQVFKLTNNSGTWKKRSLLVFDNGDGSTPFAGLIRDPGGVLYGTTSMGGVYNGGNVFSLYKSGGKWVEQTIWAFGGTGDGAQPTCDLVMDQPRNLYGTTYAGGTNGVGTVFELSNINGVWTETVLHSFTGNGDGWEPYAGLLMVGTDTFYGTTTYGGSAGGYGTVFKVFQSGGVWKEKVIYSFDGADGYEPWGTLIRDKNGALYGTTKNGAANDEGVVFMLSQSGGKWTETVLHSFDTFNGDGDGANPLAGLTWGPSGQLYGTTSQGGVGTGPGTVFELTPSGGAWTETILHSFGGQGDGSLPYGAVTLDKDGAIYGTTPEGGADNLGTVWEITP